MTDTDHRTSPPPPDPDGQAGGHADERDGFSAIGSYRDFAATGFGGESEAKGASRFLGPLALAALLVVLWYFGGVTMVIIVLALILSIVLHELGHFLTARWAGMKATEFFVGFGPRIWSTRKGETEYGVKVIPAGAYVRIIGMHNLEEIDPEDEAYTYRAKPYHKRLAVILAGPFMNIALGFVLLVVMYFAFGAPDPGQWRIKAVNPGSAAAVAGLQPGDRVLAIDGQGFSNFEQMRTILDNKAGKVADIEVLSADGRHETLEDKVLGWRLNSTGVAAIPGMFLGDVLLEPGHDDLVRSETYRQFADRLAEPGDPYTFRFQRGYYVYETTVDRPLSLPPEGASGFFGVQRDELPRVRDSLPQALGHTTQTMAAAVTKTGEAFGRFLSPEGLQKYAGTVAENVPGNDKPSTVKELYKVEGAPEDAKPIDAPIDPDRPMSIVGAVQATSTVAKTDVADAIGMLAMINLSLGLLNLLPFLPLDGGHAAVASYEAIRSRPGRPYRVDMAKLLPVTYAFLAVLLLFGLSAIFLDIRAPVVP